MKLYIGLDAISGS